MAVRALSRQGVNVTYKSVTTQPYNVNTSVASNTETSVTVKAYPRHIVANQFNHPSLIGKSVKEFYFVGNALANPPKPTDQIVQGTEVYTVYSYREHFAGGEVCLYCVLAVKQ